MTTTEEVATNFVPTGVRLKSVEKAALSVGIILAVMPLIGLTLNYMPFGIRFSSVLASLVLLTAVFVMVALIRRRQTKTEGGVLPCRKREIVSISYARRFDMNDSYVAVGGRVIAFGYIYLCLLEF